MRAYLNSKTVDVERNGWNDAFERASEEFNAKFAYISMMASEQWNNAVDALEDSPLYKHQAKRRAKQASQAWETYWKYVHLAFQDKYQLYIDFANKLYKATERDAEILYFSVKREIDRYKQPLSDVKARIMTAYKLAEICVTFYRLFYKSADKKFGYEGLGKPLRYADLTSVMNHIKAVMAATCYTSDDTEIKVCDSEDVERSLYIIVMRTKDMGWMDELGIEALMENAVYHPEYAETVRRHKESEKAQEKEKEEREIENQNKEREEIANKLSAKYKVRK